MPEMGPVQVCVFLFLFLLAVLRMEPRASRMLSKCSITELHPTPGLGKGQVVTESAPMCPAGQEAHSCPSLTGVCSFFSTVLSVVGHRGVWVFIAPGPGEVKDDAWKGE